MVSCNPGRRTRQVNDAVILPIPASRSSVPSFLIEKESEMNRSIQTAIDERRLVRLDYDPGQRLIEPHAHRSSNDRGSNPREGEFS